MDGSVTTLVCDVIYVELDIFSSVVVSVNTKKY